MYQKALTPLALAIAVIGVGIFWFRVPPKVEEAESSQDVTIVTNTVTMTDAKVRASAIELDRVVTHSLQRTITLPGRLAYDEQQHVAIQAPCDGILTEVRVLPGQKLSAGDVVAVLSSPAVADARAAVRSAAGQLRLAQKQREWNQNICSGVEALVELVESGESPEAIQARLAESELGIYREKLVTAYTRDRLALEMADSSRAAAERGAISGRVQQQRESERQSADAAVQAVIEQSLYEVQLGCRESSAKLAEAERNVELRLQQLNTLLGPAADAATVDGIEALEQSQLPLVELVAAISGTVEERLYAVNERVAAQDSLFVIANTDHLWVVANVRQGDWQAMQAELGTQMSLTVSAIPDATFTSELIQVGRMVNSETGAAQLIGQLKATDPRLRPGLFARITVPIGIPREVLAVPSDAIVVHEGVSFVFVADSDNAFRRVDVTVGETTGGLTEILDGLTIGDTIATTGVFKLKSELLLAGEEE